MKMKFILIPLLIFVAATSCFAQYYYVNTYQQIDGKGYASYIKSIDLGSKAIHDSVKVSDWGTIWTKEPIRLTSDGNNYLISFIEYGAFAKNSGPGIESVQYTILDDSLNVIKIDSFPHARIDVLGQGPNKKFFEFGMTEDTSVTMILKDGKFNLDELSNFVRVGDLDTNRSTTQPLNLGSLKNLCVVPNSDSLNLYISTRPSRYWLVKLNDLKSKIIDSVLLENIPNALIIWSYFPQNGRFYCFHLNYESHGKFEENNKDYGQQWMIPEVLIYDGATLNPIEKLRISDFTAGNYPGIEKGMAENIGNFIVYYFFQDAWMEVFAPAMLFIFDTRTNEATWLRVGWR